MIPRLTLGVCCVAALLLQPGPVFATGAGASVAGAQAAAATPRHVRIINETRHAIVRIYASQADRADSGNDILGLGTLTAGSSVLLTINDQSGACLFDLKGVFDDGDEVVHRKVDICANDAVRFVEN